jgi:hypothetical protein
MCSTLLRIDNYIQNHYNHTYLKNSRTEKSKTKNKKFNNNLTLIFKISSHDVPSKSNSRDISCSSDLCTMEDKKHIGVNKEALSTLKSWVLSPVCVFLPDQLCNLYWFSLIVNSRCHWPSCRAQGFNPQGCGFISHLVDQYVCTGKIPIPMGQGSGIGLCASA